MRLLCLLFLIGTLSIPGAQACTYFDASTDEEFFRKADRVFAGFVTGVEYRRPPKGSPQTSEWGTGSEHAPFGWIFVEYELRDVLKGPKDDPAPVVTWNLYFGGCGVPIAAGTEMMFLVSEFGPSLTDEERKFFPDDAIGMLLVNSPMLSPNHVGRDTEIERWREIAQRVQESASPKEKRP
ncbi:hypothetical protein [Roseibium sp. MMSF_3544]|uniref:hypothetical protein n=1 Tax=unclassified Roseibium TaxID=2629323 RepID=UPI00273E6CCE|nr:hypothetical protein [Roseibium sp. MMSF_3544]